MQQESINKSIILDFYRRAVGQGDIAFAEEIIAEDYIQHSPLVKPGKAGLLEALNYMKQMPKPAATSAPFMRLIAEGEYVVTNMCFEWDGKQKAVLDLFRLQDGKVSEHWDAMQDKPETSLNDNALMDGPMPLDDKLVTATNKEVARGFFQRIFDERNLDNLTDLVASDLVQHRPEIANGLAGLIIYWQKNRDVAESARLQRIIGEADFVVIQYDATLAGQAIMFYDVFRLSAGKIVEQWGLQQAIP
ncbi:nuclear transport factor 2 family protein [Spirosoma sp.]|uniref:nuclear transport factor 2 family protein n=1 Tax=Spirosoma sp. TaxID=1899569 RepID=UPI003B3A0E2A